MSDLIQMTNKRAFDYIYASVSEDLQPGDLDADVFAERVYGILVTPVPAYPGDDTVEFDADQITSTMDAVREDQRSAYEESRVG